MKDFQYSQIKFYKYKKANRIWENDLILKGANSHGFSGFSACGITVQHDGNECNYCFKTLTTRQRERKNKNSHFNRNSQEFLVQKIRYCLKITRYFILHTYIQQI